MAKRKAPIEISVRTPLPASMVSTLGSLIEAAWPGTRLGSAPPGSNQIIFEVPDQRPRAVSSAAAAELAAPSPADGDMDVYELGPEGISVGTPVDIAQALLPILQASFEANPDAQNYLEMPIRDPEAECTYLLTFSRSAAQTPHELRTIAEEKLRTSRAEISQAHTRAVHRLLMVPRVDGTDSYAAGVKAALNALREQNFGRQDIDD